MGGGNHAAAATRYLSLFVIPRLVRGTHTHRGVPREIEASPLRDPRKRQRLWVPGTASLRALAEDDERMGDEFVALGPKPYCNRPAN